MTDNAEQAAELVELAQRQHCVLQVGHVERFNPVFHYLQSVASEPRFIEAHRLSPYPSRSTDIGVVLDLMIHDLEIILHLVKSEIVSINGKPVFRYMKALPVGDVCMSCHGPAAGLDASLKAKLLETYPHDQATGYAKGEISGALTVKRPL